MIMDYGTLLSRAQAVTATAVSTDIYDLGENGGNLGAGYPLKFFVSVMEDFAGLTDLTISLEVADAEDFSDKKVLFATGAIEAADLVAGAKVMGNIPFGVTSKSKYRYARFNYTVNGTATAGKVNAGFVLDTDEHNYFKSGFEIKDH